MKVVPRVRTLVPVASRAMIVFVMASRRRKIEFDSSGNQYIAHWLDSFGGAGARVVGVGPFSPGKIEIIYPYAERRFRNVFKYDPGKDQWTLVIESEDKPGTWALFARYDIVREK